MRANIASRISRVAAGILVAGTAVLISTESSAAWQQEELRIVVIEGEDSVNIIGQGTAVPTVVEVRDRNDLPVSGALVSFLLGDGGTASLNAGLSQVAVTTNALGQAAVTVNPIASGAVQLQVSAAFQGQTAAAAITQTNFATAAQAAAAGAGAAGGGATATGGGAGGGGGGTGGATATGGAAGGGGGGLGTGALIGIAAAGAGAAAGVAVATRNQPPVAALNVSPDGAGMMGLTEYRFDGGGSSDPDQDSLTYSWNFGDGSSGSGVTTTHVYNSAGTFSVTLTVSDGKEQAITTGSVTVTQDLEGRFLCTSATSGVGVFHLDPVLNLTQNGTSISGEFRRLGSEDDRREFVWTASGTLASSNNFVCPCDLRLTLRGTASNLSDAEHLVGTVDNGAGSISLTREGSFENWIFTRQ